MISTYVKNADTDVVYLVFIKLSITKKIYYVLYVEVLWLLISLKNWILFWDIIILLLILILLSDLITAKMEVYKFVDLQNGDILLEKVKIGNEYIITNVENDNKLL